MFGRRLKIPGIHKYSEEIRRKCVKRVVDDKESAKQVAEEIGLARADRIYDWARGFGISVYANRRNKTLVKRDPEPEAEKPHRLDLWHLSEVMCRSLGTDRGAELVREYLAVRKASQ